MRDAKIIINCFFFNCSLSLFPSIVSLFLALYTLIMHISDFFSIPFSLLALSLSLWCGKVMPSISMVLSMIELIGPKWVQGIAWFRIPDTEWMLRSEWKPLRWPLLIQTSCIRLDSNYPLCYLLTIYDTKKMKWKCQWMNICVLAMKPNNETTWLNFLVFCRTSGGLTSSSIQSYTAWLATSLVPTTQSIRWLHLDKIETTQIWCNANWSWTS